MDRVQRRDFLIAAGALLAASLAANAEQAAKVARIGFLALGSLESPEVRAIVDALRQGLREHGYVEGQNIIIEYRAAAGKLEQLPRLASELVGLKVDLICVGSTAQAGAARQATCATLIGQGHVCAVDEASRRITLRQ
jgi:putative ABC transport system substrate-binding protein